MDKSFRIMPFMCKQQTEELHQLLAAADDIGAAATMVASQGGMGYEQLIQARDRFKTILLNVTSHSRIFQEEVIV